MSSSAKAQIVILAGGQGTRFWPLSRRLHPKQFLPMGRDGRSLLQETARRVEPVTAKSGLWVATAREHVDLVRNHLPEARLIVEPAAKNTAASIAFAAVTLLAAGREMPMVVLPADHAVSDEQSLCDALAEAIRLAADSDMLVTVGITPTFPHTGYGYIKKGAPIGGRAYSVERFIEKPDRQQAAAMVESMDHFWNSGMFVWRPRVLLGAVALHMPALSQAMEEIGAALSKGKADEVVSEVFGRIEPASIDTGLMEKAGNVGMVVAPPFGWSDVGSWDAWAEQLSSDERGNVSQGQALLLDSSSTIVHSKDRLVVALGLTDMVIIDAGDAVLVCPRSRVQDVKTVPEALKRIDRLDLL